MSTAAEVIAGRAAWAVEESDALAWWAGLPDDSVDLAVWSPPYESARTYGIGFKLRGQAWVDWVVEVFRAAAPKVTGPIVCVCEGQTRRYRWSATPALLMADLHRAGFHLRKPPAYHRIGIPGSGGADWWRNDYEHCVVVTRPGRLPYSDNTATGHPPRWAPGGAMSHRLSDGQRVNQWGKSAGAEYAQRRKGGRRQKAARPSHRTHTKRRANGEMEEQAYVPPVLANPGNVIKCNVGGGQMGDDLAHENEAPFPEELVEPFVRCFCPPGGIVADCFAGSGTTLAVAVKWSRRAIGCDLRRSQVELVRRRLGAIPPALFRPA